MIKYNYSCRICKKVFEAQSKTRKYCSYECSVISQTSIKLKALCAGCNKEFGYKRYKPKTHCSLKCVPRSGEHLINCRRESFWKTATEEQKMARFKEMYESKVIKKDGCWGWSSFLDNGGSGKLGSRDHLISHYRFSYLLYKGPITAGMSVLHKCHNRACSNPDHLYLGTNKDNMRDMYEAGRNNSSRKHSKNAKLNEEKAVEIKKLLKDGLTQKRIAEIFNVSQGTIQNIKEGVTWRTK